MRKCPGAWAGGRQEGRLIRQREFIRPWRVTQCAGDGIIMTRRHETTHLWGAATTPSHGTKELEG